jgi:hypothetical protein
VRLVRRPLVLQCDGAGHSTLADCAVWYCRYVMRATQMLLLAGIVASLFPKVNGPFSNNHAECSGFAYVGLLAQL